MAHKSEAPYPYLGINGEYLDKAFLDAAWRDLLSKTKVWSAGLENPSPADRLAYLVLRQITMRQPDDA